MNTKEFLKPTSPKIIIFIILLIILIFLPTIPVKINVQCVTEPCHPIEDYSRLIDIFSQEVIITSSTILSIIIKIIVIYIASCLIINLYKKQK